MDFLDSFFVVYANILQRGGVIKYDLLKHAKKPQTRKGSMPPISKFKFQINNLPIPISKNLNRVLSKTQ
jgi:hypothetical protein